jgi:hypothetical protein
MELLRTRLVLTRAIAAMNSSQKLKSIVHASAGSSARQLCRKPVCFRRALDHCAAPQSNSITDLLAPWLLAARVVQSSVHLASLSVPAVNVRFMAFLVQIAIAVYWTGALLLS